MPVAAALPAIIGGVATIGGAAIASNSANRSAQAVQSAADSSNATQLQIYNQQRADMEPWRQFGLGALGQLSSLYNLNWQAPQSMTGSQWQQPQTGGGAGGVGGQPGLGQGYNTGGSGLIGNLFNQVTPGNTQTGLPTPLPNDVSVLGQGSPGNDLNPLLSPAAMTDKGLANPTMAATGTDQPLIAGGPNAQGTFDPSQPLINGGGGNGYGPQPMTGGQPGTPATGGQQPLNTAPFFASPDYQFRLNEGNRNRLNAFANTGNLDSGAAQRALLRYGQDTASGEFNNYVNRLASFAGVGQTATQQNNALATNYGNQVAQNNYAGANARASAYQQQGQAWQQGLGGLAGAGMWAFNNWGGGK